MKKLFIILSSLFLLLGCSLIEDTPSKKVEEVLKKYQNLDEAVLSDLELTSESSTFTETSQKEKYMKAMRMQYSDLKYKIVSEEVEGDEAEVKVNITVYDFYKVQKNANDYLNNNKEEFMDEGVYNEKKFLNYKLDKMLEVDERVDYTITVNLTKEDDKWKVEDFDNTTLEKIHGTYNYE